MALKISLSLLIQSRLSQIQVDSQVNFGSFFLPDDYGQLAEIKAYLRNPEGLSVLSCRQPLVATQSMVLEPAASASPASSPTSCLYSSLVSASLSSHFFCYDLLSHRLSSLLSNVFTFSGLSGKYLKHLNMVYKTNKKT